MRAARQIDPSPTLSAAEVQQWFDSQMPVEIIDARLLHITHAANAPDPDVVCEVLAVIDQNYRRRRLNAAEAKRLKGRIERYALGGLGAPGAVASSAVAGPADLTRPVFTVASKPSLPPPPPFRPPGAQIGLELRGRYVLKSLLGEGGMSCVYRASDRQRESLSVHGGHVALKMLRASVATRPDALQSLHLEYEHSQRLSHPSIINVFDIDSDGDQHFITMELLEGELLSELIKRLRPRQLLRAQAWRIIALLGDALAYSHEMNVVHADVKPGNVMITRSGELRLFDFGAAWLAHCEPWIYEPGGASQNGATPSYASADRLTGAAPTTGDDIYSFCCVAYELLSGAHPYGRRPANQARDDGLRPVRIYGLSHRQWRGLQQGLAFEREDRPADMRQLLCDLGLAAPSRSVPSLSTVQVEPARPASRVAGLMMVLLGTLTFAAVQMINAGVAFEDITVVAAVKPWLATAQRFIAELFR